MKTKITSALPALPLAAALFFAAAATGNVFAATIIVTSAEDSGEGSLRDAVAAAAHGDVITFDIPQDSGAFDAQSGKATITLTSGEIKFDKRLTFKGGGKIILDGGNNGRILNYDAYRTLTLDGLTFKNGSAYRPRAVPASRPAPVVLADEPTDEPTDELTDELTGASTATNEPPARAESPEAANASPEAASASPEDASPANPAISARPAIPARSASPASPRDARDVRNEAAAARDALMAKARARTQAGVARPGASQPQPQPQRPAAPGRALYSSAGLSGGAVFAGGFVEATNCEFIENIAGGDGVGVNSGGGVYYGGGNSNNSGGGAIFTQGSVAASGCTFSGNASLSSNGGAIRAGNGSISITNCVFTNNRTGNGSGAVFLEKGTITAADCVFTGNSAGAYGGAARAEGGAIIAADCAFINNSARRGGALSAQTSIAAINCAFADNAADDSGGAVTSYFIIAANSSFVCNRTGAVSSGAAHADIHAQLLHCTVADNIGTGIGTHSLGIHNSIVAGNSAAIQIGGAGDSRTIQAISTNRIDGAGLIEGITEGAARAAIFGANEPDAGGIMAPLPGGIADKTADALDASAVEKMKTLQHWEHFGVSDAIIADIASALRKDISGAPRPADGKVSYGAIE